MTKYYFILCCFLFFGTFSIGQNIGSIAKDPNFFPIAVWVQNPANAVEYKANGINMFIGLWGGLDQAKLDNLKKAKVKVICHQNEFGLSHLNDTTIYAWMHGDEPDNARMNKTTKKYDPCVDPAVIIKSYEDIKENDPTRPVYINLGQGVSYINYVGRGVCKGDLDKYKVATNGYLKGCDIGSFDIYPINNKDAESQNNLYFVSKGIDSLKSWTNNLKPVWCWIECTKIGEKNPRKPTTAEVKSEVWMALIHGANGFGYFCHSFVPPRDVAALLHDSIMLQAIKSINTQVSSLAAILNSSNTTKFASVSSSNTGVPVDIMTKNYGKANYIFSVGMRCGFTTATFNVASGTSVEVIGEGRTINIADGKFSDEFSPYDVHLYRIKM